LRRGAPRVAGTADAGQVAEITGDRRGGTAFGFGGAALAAATRHDQRGRHQRDEYSLGSHVFLLRGPRPTPPPHGNYPLRIGESIVQFRRARCPSSVTAEQPPEPMTDDPSTSAHAVPALTPDAQRENLCSVYENMILGRCRCGCHRYPPTSGTTAVAGRCAHCC